MTGFKKLLSVMLAVTMIISVMPTVFAASDSKTFAKGDVVTFGIYEQDDNAETQDALEWIIADKDGDVLKLITKHIVNTTTPLATAQNNAGTWGACSEVRTEFIPDFVNESFTENEKAAIIPTNNNAVDQNGVVIGEDLVYIPSIAEISEMFETDADRVSSNTPIAAKTRNATPAGEGACYLLRDDAYKMNARTYYANYVDGEGKIRVAPDGEMAATKSQTVGIRLVTRINANDLHPRPEKHKVVFQCKHIDENGNEKNYFFLFEDGNHNMVNYQLVNHGDLAVVPAEDEIKRHLNNEHYGEDYLGYRWSPKLEAVTEDTIYTLVLEVEAPVLPKPPVHPFLAWLALQASLVISLVEEFVEINFPESTFKDTLIEKLDIISLYLLELYGPYLW